MRRHLLTMGLVSGLVLLAIPGIAQAQLGSGWTQYSPTKKVHLDDESGLKTFNWTAQKSVCSPTCADYKYDAASDTETFRVLDNRSNRSEIRLKNEYSKGRRQFQGYVRFDAPLNDESLFQIFGSTSGATQLMIRGFKGQGGEIRGGGKTLATGIYGVERRINVIHEQEDKGNRIRIYVNGSLKHSMADNEGVTNYHKYGCYGTLKTGAATVRWRAARSDRDGTAPASAASETEELAAAPDDEQDLDEEELLAAEEELAIEQAEAAGEDPSSVAGGCTLSGASGRRGAGGVLLVTLAALATWRRRRRGQGPA